MNMNTQDLSDFGYREIEMTKDLLSAWVDTGLPENFNNDGVAVEFNPNSGCVFLVNEDCQTSMIDDGKLKIWLYLPDTGIEGFVKDIINDYGADELTSDDLEYLKQNCELEEHKMFEEKYEDIEEDDED